MSKRNVPAKHPPDAILTIETRYGRLLAFKNDKPISDALSAYGEWAEIEIEFLSQFLPGSDVVLDVGSHIGVHSSAFAQLAPAATVHAFEPHPALYDLLVQNTSPGGKNIVPHQVAIGGVDEKRFVRPLPQDTPVNAGATVVELEATPGAAEVSMRTIDSLSFERVGFIKLDIEGCEAEALRGASKLIGTCRPAVYCEVNTLENGVSLLEAARMVGLDTYFVATPAYNPDNVRAAKDNMFGFANETGLLLLPHGRPAPDPKRTSLVRAVRTIDDLAEAFIAVPRFGDSGPFDRNAKELRSRLTGLHGQFEAEQKRSETLASQLAAVETKVATLEETQRALQVERRKCMEIQSENDGLRSQQLKVQDSIKSLTDQNEGLRKSLNQFRSEATEARTVLVEAQIRIAALSADLETVRKEAQDSLALASLEQGKQADLAERLLALEHELTIEREAMSGTLQETLGKVDAAERRFEALRATLRGERDLISKLRSDVQTEQQNRERVAAEVELEKSRRGSLLDLLTPADLPSARKGSLGAIARRYTRGRMADALRVIEASALFDEAWYVKTYADAVRDFHPAAHYLLYGGYGGLNPGPQFDSDGYLAVNPDVRASGQNPLLHYLRWGARELRRWTPVPQEERPAPLPAPQPTMWSRPKAPPMGFFRQLSEHLPAERQSPTVDVIIPVYRSYDDTLACIASVLSSTNVTPYELIVIDDCSPEPEVSAALDELAQLRLITLLKNENNLGFVGTVNRGMSLNADRDVLLLNSDTLVFNNWLDRILDHARGQHQIATVTPFTNNGTICSYPKFCRDNKEAFDRPFDELDRLIGAVNSKQSVEIPTGVGFCMYVNRRCLNEIGPFDEETFGKGYGEENDFCMRASKTGWKNLHALDVFVFHSGETSFADTAHESKRRGLALLHQKHPEYDRLVQTYITNDPSRAARVAADVAQLIGYIPARATLCISHTSGGGIDRYLQDYARTQSNNGRDILLFVPAVAGSSSGRLTAPGLRGGLPNLDGIDLAQDLDVLRQALRLLQVDRIEVHSTVGWSYKVPAMIERLAETCSLGYSVMLHDYVAVCPQINFINDSGKYCGEEGTAQCHRCLSLMKDQPRAIHPDIADPARLNIVAWRKMYGRLLDHADRVSAPSADTKERVRRYFTDLDIDVVPHTEDLSSIPNLAISPLPGQNVRVGVIGAIGPHKGSRVLLECARDALRRNLPIEFVVVGYTDIDRELEQAQVTITGRYEEAQIADMLAAQRMHVAFLPSVWPETFCYTLSIALASDIPTCVFDLGAQAERLKGSPRSLLLPIGIADDAPQINNRLLQFAESLRATAAPSHD